MLNEPVGRLSPLFDAYPRLGRAVPWLPIGCWPTPVTEARQFARAHGLAGLYIKREDMTHAECGGNKVRSMEFMLADAQQSGAGTIVTLGAAGSHHISRTAWHAKRLGIQTVGIVIHQPAADYARQNLLRGLAAGVEYIPTGYVMLVPRVIRQFVRADLRSNGRPPYFAPGGGTSPLTCLGHVNAALELKQQIEAGVLPEPECLFVALGSLGTAAGLALGCKLAGLRTRVVGVVVFHRWYCTSRRWARLAGQVHRLMQRHDPTVPDVVIDAAELPVVATALGSAYAEVTDSSQRLARQMHDAEGIELDGTYTAKVLDGALQYIDRHRLRHKEHLFWHTYQPMGSGAAEPVLEIDSLPAGLSRYLSKRDVRNVVRSLGVLPVAAGIG